MTANKERERVNGELHATKPPGWTRTKDVTVYGLAP